MAEKPRNRRDFIFVATGAAAAGGIALVAQPMMKHMSPAADVIAAAGLDVDVSSIQEGQEVQVSVQGRPVLIRHRTRAEIASALRDDTVEMKDPATDRSRLRKKPDGTIDPRFLIVMPVCTHFGAIVVSETGRYNGFYCPAHDAQFDASGRARSGPAPTNMTIPPYYWTSDSALRLQFLPIE